MLERFLRAFWRWTSRPGQQTFVADDPGQIARCQRAVRLFYAVALGLLLFAPTNLQASWPVRPDPLWPPHPDPLWPLSWMHFVPWKLGRWSIHSLAFGGALLALIRPRIRWARVAAGLGVFLEIALYMTYSGLKHKWYIFVVTAVLFALLPDLHAQRDARRGAQRDVELAYKRIVWGAFAFAMSTYAVAGLMKLVGIAEALSLGDTRVLRLDQVPLSLHRSLLKPHETILGGAVLDHPVLMSLGMGVVILVELLSAVVPFRPRWHRPWCLVLVGLHVSTYLSMNILFFPSVCMLLLWAALSPFAPRSVRP